MFNRLTALFRRYPSFDRYLWLNSSKDWRFVLGAVVLMFLAGFFNHEARLDQWKFWSSHPDIFFADGEPLVSTTDAGYFLSLARDYRNGVTRNGFLENRFYPDNTDTYQTANNPDYAGIPTEPQGATDVPMLSFIIAKLSEYFFADDLLTPANLMLPITGFLTAIAVAGMFWAAGYPAEGAIAATGFGLSTSYFVRTSIGRIDTDQLVMFFLALCVSFILLAARQRNISRQMGFVLLAALSALILEWWYSQALFIVILPLLAGFAVYTHQLNIKRALGATVIFTLATNPVVVIPSFWTLFAQIMERFFNIKPKGNNFETAINLNYPNTFSTVTELNRPDLIQILDLMAITPEIGMIGLGGFFIFLILKPSRGMVFLPFFFIGFCSIYLGQRFIFYSTPFIWFAIAWLLLSATRCLCCKFTAANPRNFSANSTVLTISAAAIVLVAWLSLGMRFTPPIPHPSFSAPIVNGFSLIKKFNQGDDGIVATWWDYGYFLHYKSGMATFHDGGKQTTPRTYFIARGMIVPNPAELIQTAKFIATEGSAGIAKKSTSAKQLYQVISTAKMPEKPLYIMLTNQMTNWFTTISKLGLHDIASGQSPSNLKLGGYGYHRLNCSNVGGNKLNCQNRLIDITQGTIDGKLVIDRTVQTVDGKIKNSKKYNNGGTMVLHISQLASGQSQITLVPRPTWDSTFNKLYELGVYDSGRLELVIDNYPAVRVYKILQ
jgi:dolichyl-diphosphooligosaccharide--protein glycosyltransferase